MSKRLAFNFVKVSMVYFIIGAFWMSFAGIIVPEPEPELAHQIYEVAMTHVMLIGWASFAIIGVLYYFVPKAAENEIHSERLGTVHFWITNIVVPLGVLLLAYAGFFVESLLKTGVASMEEVLGHPSFAPLYLTFIVLAIIGLAGQVIFAYNIYRTMQK